MSRKPFHFKQFDIYHDKCSMKVGTDGVLLGAWASVYDCKRLLDIGTGSGLIAIMAAQRTSNNVLIDGVEIESNAYSQAVENVNNCTWQNRIKIHQTSIQQYSEFCSYKYDIIISNPPFFLSGSKSDDTNRNTARHSDALTQHQLIEAVKKLLADNGKFNIILPLKEGNEFVSTAKTNGLYCNRLTKVKPKIDKQIERILIEFSRKENEC